MTDLNKSKWCCGMAEAADENPLKMKVSVVLVKTQTYEFFLMPDNHEHGDMISELILGISDFVVKHISE